MSTKEKGRAKFSPRQIKFLELYFSGLLDKSRSPGGGLPRVQRSGFMQYWRGPSSPGGGHRCPNCAVIPGQDVA